MTTPFLTSYTWLWVVVSENEALVYPSFFTSSQLLKFVPIAEKLCHIFMLIDFFQACDDWKYIVFLMVFGGLAFLLKKLICTTLFQNQLSPWTIYIPSLIQSTSCISCQTAFIESIICILNLPSKSNWWIFTEEFEN